MALTKTSFVSTKKKMVLGVGRIFLVEEEGVLGRSTPACRRQVRPNLRSSDYAISASEEQHESQFFLRLQ